MQENLVIVESPAKAKTIEKFLGKDFIVKSSFGHIRDLAKKDLGINIGEGYKPVYEIPDDKKETIFESFNHLSDRRPQFESSSGLGLAIVKELVGNLNGTITLRSGNSKVAFTVVLPFTLNAEKTDSAAESYEYTVSEIDNLLTESDVMAPNDRHDRKACNIVVIEDDPNLRLSLIHISEPTRRS